MLRNLIFFGSYSLLLTFEVWEGIEKGKKGMGMRGKGERMRRRGVDW